MTNSLVHSSPDIPDASIPVPAHGEFDTDTATVLKAIFHDPRDSSEKDLAATQLKVWAAIKPLLVPDTEDEVGGRLLDICFLGWEKRSLVQFSAMMGSAIGGAVQESYKGRGIEKPIKLLKVAGKTQ